MRRVAITQIFFFLTCTKVYFLNTLKAISKAVIFCMRFNLQASVNMWLSTRAFICSSMLL